MSEEIFNPHGLMVEAGILTKALFPSGDRWAGWSHYAPGGNGKKVVRSTWAEAVAQFPSVKEWATIKGGGVWFPAIYADRVNGLKIRGRKVTVVTGVPCCVRVSADWSSSYCGKVAVSEGDWYGDKGPLCSMHTKAKERRDAKDRENRAQIRQAVERMNSQKEHASASAMWAQRLHDEFGVKAEAWTEAGHKDQRLRVLIEPERLHGMIAAAVAELREIEAPNPFEPEATVIG